MVKNCRFMPSASAASGSFSSGQTIRNWEPVPEPPLEDWRELLDAVQRLINRRRLQPEHEELVRRRMRERFPEEKF